MIHIDGSRGEGGGQVLRSAVTLSMATGRPLRIERIRAGRRRPGLRRQHLTAVAAAAEVCAARVAGLDIGSTRLDFAPGRVRPGDYRFAVGSAGSATLVLQTVLLPLCTAAGPSSLRLEGGTHNPWAPPVDFLQRVFLPLLARMGPRVAIELERPGFYPAGGGRFSVRIEPVAALRGMDLLQRGRLLERRVRALCARLPRHIGEREVRRLAQRLDLPEGATAVEQVADSAGPGNIVMLELRYERVSELFCGFGRKGVPAERVADEALEQAAAYLAGEVPVGPYLADQLMLPMALAGRGRYRSLPLTGHAHTQLDVIGRFLDLDVRLTEPEDGQALVEFGPGQPAAQTR